MKKQILVCLAVITLLTTSCAKTAFMSADKETIAHRTNNIFN